MDRERAKGNNIGDGVGSGAEHEACTYVAPAFVCSSRSLCAGASPLGKGLWGSDLFTPGVESIPAVLATSLEAARSSRLLDSILEEGP